MTFHRLGRRRRCAGRADVKDLESEVVGHSADEGFMKGMMLDVIDDRGMVGVCAGSMKCFVA